MILDMRLQGLSVTAIARRTERNSKAVCKYIGGGLEPLAQLSTPATAAFRRRRF